MSEANQATVAAVEKPIMRCYICDVTDWINMGKVSEDIDMTKGWPELGVCKTCGNCAYLVDVSKEPELLEFYRKDYRSNPNHKNLLTTTTKQNYVLMFLGELLKKAKEDKKSLVCGDVGCATGYIPAALRDRGHRATGSEYTRGYRRFAEHYYGILVTEELEPKHTYDLITCYHVLEHMMEPDKKLAKMRSMLADDGHIMISTPEWFGPLEDQTGAELAGRWQYWHKNHLNAFSAVSLQNLFRKVGLEVVKKDFVVYGQTYLLKKCEPGKPIITEDPQAVAEKVRKINAAIDLFRTGRFEEALDSYAVFPEALLGLIFNNHAKDPAAQAENFQRARESMPMNTRIRAAMGAWLFQQERFHDAKIVLGELFNEKPGIDSLFKLGWAHFHLGEYENAMNCWNKCSVLNPKLWRESVELVCKAACAMPNWEERGRAEAMRQISSQFKPEVKPLDPAMEPPKAAEEPVSVTTDAP